MKKIISLLLVLMMCVGLFAGCSKGESVDLDGVIKYLKNMYHDTDGKETAVSYTVISTVPSNGTNCDIEWTIKSIKGDASKIVTVEKGEKMTTIKVAKNHTEDVIEYELVATVKSGKESKTISFKHTIPVAAATAELTDGTYVIIVNGLSFAALGEDLGYGYAQGNPVTETVYTAADIVTIKAVDGGVTIQDCYGRYIYLKGTYNSFNVSKDMPEEGHIWEIQVVDGGYKIVNVTAQKTLAYSTSFTSWGAYAEMTDDYSYIVKVVAADANNAHTHTPETVPGKAPTCTEDGLSEGTRCSDCGAWITEQKVLPAAHAWGEWTVSTTDPSKMERICSQCGTTETKNKSNTEWVVAETPVAGTAYKFGMVQGNKGGTYYLTGAMDTANKFYMGTTADISAAVLVYLEETANGYYLYCMNGDTKTYINCKSVIGTDGNPHVNATFDAEAETVYTYDATNKIMVTDIDGEAWTLGTRSDKEYTTVGPVKVSQNGFWCRLYVEQEVQGDNEGLTSGKYSLKVGDLFVAGLAADKGYGYLPYSETAVEFTLTAVDGGYTIQMADGRYLYMTGTYNNFNVSADVPAAGHIFTITPNGDGTYTIVNVATNKTLCRDTTYKDKNGNYTNTIGAYAADAIKEGYESKFILTAIGGGDKPTFKPEKSEWSVVGWVEGSDWDKDFALWTTETGNVLESDWLMINAGGELKIRKDGKWDNGEFGLNGTSENYKVEETCRYKIRVNIETREITLIKDETYVHPEENWGVVGEMTNWADGADIALVPTGENGIYETADYITIAAGKKFKVRKDGGWAAQSNMIEGDLLEVMDSGDVTVKADGKYKIVFNALTRKISAVKYEEVTFTEAQQGVYYYYVNGVSYVVKINAESQMTILSGDYSVYIYEAVAVKGTEWNAVTQDEAKIEFKFVDGKIQLKLDGNPVLAKPVGKADADVLGTWGYKAPAGSYGADYKIVLKKDGKAVYGMGYFGEIEEAAATYTFAGGVITLTYEAYDATETVKFYALEDGTLLMLDETYLDVMVLTKQAETETPDTPSISFTEDQQGKWTATVNNPMMGDLSIELTINADGTVTFLSDYDDITATPTLTNGVYRFTTNDDGDYVEFSFVEGGISITYNYYFEDFTATVDKNGNALGGGDNTPDTPVGVPELPEWAEGEWSDGTYTIVIDRTNMTAKFNNFEAATISWDADKAMYTFETSMEMGGQVYKDVKLFKVDKENKQIIYVYGSKLKEKPLTKVVEEGGDDGGAGTPVEEIIPSLDFSASTNKDTAKEIWNNSGWTVNGQGVGQYADGTLKLSKDNTVITSTKIQTAKELTLTAKMLGNGSSGEMTSTMTFTLVDADGNTIATGYAENGESAIGAVDKTENSTKITFTFVEGKSWSDVSNLVATMTKVKGNIGIRSLTFA